MNYDAWPDMGWKAFPTTEAEETRSRGPWRGLVRTKAEVIQRATGPHESIAAFGDGVYGFCPKIGGGLRAVIPAAMLEELHREGFLDRNSHGNYSPTMKAFLSGIRFDLD